MIFLTNGQVDDLIKAMESRSSAASNFYRIRYRIRGIFHRPRISRIDRLNAIQLADYICSPVPPSEGPARIYPCLVEDHSEV